MEWSEFTTELAKSIETAYNEIKDSIEKSDDKDNLIKTFKDGFIERVSSEYKDSTKLEDITALVELVVDELCNR